MANENNINVTSGNAGLTPGATPPSVQPAPKDATTTANATPPQASVSASEFDAAKAEVLQQLGSTDQAYKSVLGPRGLLDENGQVKQDPKSIESAVHFLKSSAKMSIESDGDPMKAARLLEAACKLDPKNSYVHFLAAEALKQAGDKNGNKPEIKKELFRLAAKHLLTSKRMEMGFKDGFQLYRSILKEVGYPQKNPAKLREFFDEKLTQYQKYPQNHRRLAVELEVLSERLAKVGEKDPAVKYEDFKRINAYYKKLLAYQEESKPLASMDGTPGSPHFNSAEHAHLTQEYKNQLAKHQTDLKAQLNQDLKVSEEGKPTPERLKTIQLYVKISKELEDYDALAHNLKAWTKQIMNSSSEEMAIQERFNHLGEIVKLSLLARDHDKSVEHEINSNLSAIETYYKNIVGSIKVEGADKALDILFHQVVAFNDYQLLPFLSYKGIQDYAKQTLSASKNYQKALEIKDAEGRRKALVTCLREYTQLRDPKMVEEIVKKIRLDIPLFDRRDDQVQIYTGMYLIVKGSGLSSEEELKTFTKQLAEALVSYSEDAAPMPKAQNLMVALQAYQALGDGEAITKLAPELQKTRDALLNYLHHGLPKSGIAKPTNPSHRLNVVKMAIQIDHAVLHKYVQDAQNEKVDQNDLNKRPDLKILTATLDVYKNEILAHTASLPLEERIQHIGFYLQAAKGYEFLTQPNFGYTELEQNPSFAQPKFALLKSEELQKRIQDMMELLDKQGGVIIGHLNHMEGASANTKLQVAAKLSAALIQAYPKKGKPPQYDGETVTKKLADFQEKLRPFLEAAVQEELKDVKASPKRKKILEAELVCHLEKLFEDSIKSGESDVLNDLPTSYVSQVSEKLQGAHKLLDEAQQGSGANTFEKSLQAAQAFGALGMGDRVQEALKPIQQIANRPDVPAEIRANLLGVIAQTYQSSGMKEEALGALDRIIALDKKGGDPKIHDLAEFAKGMKAFNLGDVKAAKEVFKNLPNNEVAQEILGKIESFERLQLAAVNSRILGIMEQLMLDSLQAYPEGPFVGSDYPGDKAHIQYIGSMSYHPSAIHNFTAEARALLLSGQSETLQDALQYLLASPKYEGFQDLYFGEFSKLHLDQFVNWGAFQISEKDWNTKLMAFAKLYTMDKNYHAGMTLGSLLSEEEGVGAEAKKLMKDMPDTIFWDSIFTELKNASIIFAESKEEAAINFAILVATFGFGKIVATGVKMGMAIRAARIITASVKVAEVANDARKLARVARIVRATQIAIEATTMTAEAAAVAFANIMVSAAREGQAPDFSHFGKEFGSMMVLFGLGKVFHPAIHTLGGGKVAQYFAGVGAFVASKYIDPLLGFKPPVEDPFWKVVVRCFVEDAGMKLGGHLAGKIPGLHKMEMTAQQKLVHAEILPKLAKLGMTKDGELTEGGQYVYQAMMIHRGRGGKIADLDKFRQSLTEAELANLVKGLKNYPGTYETKEGMALAYVIALKGSKKIEKLDGKELAKDLNQLKKAVELALRKVQPLGDQADPQTKENYANLKQVLLEAAILKGWSLQDLGQLIKSKETIEKNLEASALKVMGSEKAGSPEGQAYKQMLLAQALRAAPTPDKVGGEIQRIGELIAQKQQRAQELEKGFQEEGQRIVPDGKKGYQLKDSHGKVFGKANAEEYAAFRKYQDQSRETSTITPAVIIRTVNGEKIQIPLTRPLSQTAAQGMPLVVPKILQEGTTPQTVGKNEHATPISSDALPQSHASISVYATRGQAPTIREVRSDSPSSEPMRAEADAAKATSTVGARVREGVRSVWQTVQTSTSGMGRPSLAGGVAGVAILLGVHPAKAQQTAQPVVHGVDLPPQVAKELGLEAKGDSGVTLTFGEAPAERGKQTGKQTPASETGKAKGKDGIMGVDTQASRATTFGDHAVALLSLGMLAYVAFTRFKLAQHVRKAGETLGFLKTATAKPSQGSSSSDPRGGKEGDPKQQPTPKAQIKKGKKSKEVSLKTVESLAAELGLKGLGKKVLERMQYLASTHPKSMAECRRALKVLNKVLPTEGPNAQRVRRAVFDEVMRGYLSVKEATKLAKNIQRGEVRLELWVKGAFFSHEGWKLRKIRNSGFAEFEVLTAETKHAAAIAPVHVVEEIALPPANGNAASEPILLRTRVTIDGVIHPAELLAKEARVLEEAIPSTERAEVSDTLPSPEISRIVSAQGRDTIPSPSFERPAAESVERGEKFEEVEVFRVQGTMPVSAPEMARQQGERASDTIRSPRVEEKVATDADSPYAELTITELADAPATTSAPKVFGPLPAPNPPPKRRAKAEPIREDNVAKPSSPSEAPLPSTVKMPRSRTQVPGELVFTSTLRAPAFPSAPEATPSKKVEGREIREGGLEHLTLMALQKGSAQGDLRQEVKDAAKTLARALGEVDRSLGKSLMAFLGAVYRSAGEIAIPEAREGFAQEAAELIVEAKQNGLGQEGKYLWIYDKAVTLLGKYGFSRDSAMGRGLLGLVNETHGAARRSRYHQIQALLSNVRRWLQERSSSGRSLKDIALNASVLVDRLAQDLNPSPRGRFKENLLRSVLNLIAKHGKEAPAAPKAAKPRGYRPVEMTELPASDLESIPPASEAKTRRPPPLPRRDRLAIASRKKFLPVRKPKPTMRLPTDLSAQVDHVAAFYSPYQAAALRLKTKLARREIKTPRDLKLAIEEYRKAQQEAGDYWVSDHFGPYAMVRSKLEVLAREAGNGVLKVLGRTKDAGQLAEKLVREQVSDWRAINDVTGLRVVVKNRAAAENLIASVEATAAAEGWRIVRNDGVAQLDKSRASGYRDTKVAVEVTEEIFDPTTRRMEKMVSRHEIQILTEGMDVVANAEHKEYKSHITPETLSEEKYSLTSQERESLLASDREYINIFYSQAAKYLAEATQPEAQRTPRRVSEFPPEALHEFPESIQTKIKRVQALLYSASPEAKREVADFYRRSYDYVHRVANNREGDPGQKPTLPSDIFDRLPSETQDRIKEVQNEMTRLEVEQAQQRKTIPSPVALENDTLPSPQPDMTEIPFQAAAKEARKLEEPKDFSEDHSGVHEVPSSLGKPPPLSPSAEIVKELNRLVENLEGPLQEQLRQYLSDELRAGRLRSMEAAEQLIGQVKRGDIALAESESDGRVAIVSVHPFELQDRLDHLAKAEIPEELGQSFTRRIISDFYHAAHEYVEAGATGEMPIFPQDVLHQLPPELRGEIKLATQEMEVVRPERDTIPAWRDTLPQDIAPDGIAETRLKDILDRPFAKYHIGERLETFVDFDGEATPELQERQRKLAIAILDDLKTLRHSPEGSAFLEARDRLDKVLSRIESIPDYQSNPTRAAELFPIVEFHYFPPEVAGAEIRRAGEDQKTVPPPKPPVGGGSGSKFPGGPGGAAALTVGFITALAGHSKAAGPHDPHSSVEMMTEALWNYGPGVAAAAIGIGVLYGGWKWMRSAMVGSDKSRPRVETKTIHEAPLSSAFAKEASILENSDPIIEAQPAVVEKKPRLANGNEPVILSGSGEEAVAIFPVDLKRHAVDFETTVSLHKAVLNGDEVLLWFFKPNAPDSQNPRKMGQATLVRAEPYHTTKEVAERLGITFEGEEARVVSENFYWGKKARQADLEGPKKEANHSFLGPLALAANLFPHGLEVGDGMQVGLALAAGAGLLALPVAIWAVSNWMKGKKAGHGVEKVVPLPPEMKRWTGFDALRPENAGELARIILSATAWARPPRPMSNGVLSWIGLIRLNFLFEISQRDPQLADYLWRNFGTYAPGSVPGTIPHQALPLPAPQPYQVAAREAPARTPTPVPPAPPPDPTYPAEKISWLHDPRTNEFESILGRPTDDFRADYQPELFPIHSRVVSRKHAQIKVTADGRRFLVNLLNEGISMGIAARGTWVHENGQWRKLGPREEIELKVGQEFALGTVFPADPEANSKPKYVNGEPVLDKFGEPVMEKYVNGESFVGEPKLDEETGAAVAYRLGKYGNSLIPLSMDSWEALNPNEDTATTLVRRIK